VNVRLERTIGEGLERSYRLFAGLSGLEGDTTRLQECLDGVIAPLRGRLPAIVDADCVFAWDHRFLLGREPTCPPPDQQLTLPPDAGTPPADAETAPGGGRTARADAGTPPLEEEPGPLDGGPPPADAETAPIDTAAAPTDAAAPDGGADAPPADAAPTPEGDTP
jgi:hypothetical protein